MDHRAIIVCGLLLLSAQVHAEPRCLEQCQETRQRNVTDFEACAQRAVLIKDQLMAVKHKTNCRKQFPLVDCANLSPCTAKAPAADDKKAQAPAEAMTMESLTFAGGKNVSRFAPKQKVEIQYEVRVNKKNLPNLWFDQVVTVYDLNGNQVLELQDSFERSGEMVTAYQFKSSFTIPENLSAGQYKIQVQVREKFSRWQSQQEQTFSVS